MELLFQAGEPEKLEGSVISADRAIRPLARIAGV